ncbi:MAG: hypothetical protein KR126chlam3_00347 [Chlamydiae bacterium]|nr:hypothetical protein [Chlamydiota bacterium]
MRLPHEVPVRQASVLSLKLPSDSTSRWTPLLRLRLPLAGRLRDFHPIVTCHAGHTSTQIKDYGMESSGVPLIKSAGG